MATISQKEIYMGKFKDKRLDKRALRVSALLYAGRSSSIHEISPTESEQKATYRFLANAHTEEGILIDTVKERSSYLCTDKNVLVLQDTSEINLDNHRNRLQRNTGIGLTGNNKDLGFFMHTSLVLDAVDETVLGFSDLQLWHRKEDKLDKDERQYSTLPIEEKESYKWIKACQESKRHLCSAASITFIEDREGDIYEQFASIPDARTHLIIRSRDNRRLSDGRKLFDALSSQNMAGSYEIAIVTDLRKGIEKRTASVEVRFCEVSIAKPKTLKKPDISNKVDLYAIEVKETNENVPQAIKWRLLTTHPVTSYEQAVGIINQYRIRWYVEQLFRLLKKKGFAIESSELESGWAIRKLTVMALNAALRVMQLLLAYGNEQSQPIDQVFDEGEIKCMEHLNKKLQGETEKSKNKNNPTNLSWATWIIARLGGWKNYDSKRPPGPIILKRGLDKFASIYDGWKLALSSA
jgi:Transposase DNA-binding